MYSHQHEYCRSILQVDRLIDLWDGNWFQWCESIEYSASGTEKRRIHRGATNCNELGRKRKEEWEINEELAAQSLSSWIDSTDERSDCEGEYDIWRREKESDVWQWDWILFNGKTHYSNSVFHTGNGPPKEILTIPDAVLARNRHGKRKKSLMYRLFHRFVRGGSRATEEIKDHSVMNEVNSMREE